MDEISEMMEDGTLCACCGILLIEEGEESAGYPEYCVNCKEPPDAPGFEGGFADNH